MWLSSKALFRPIMTVPIIQKATGGNFEPIVSLLILAFSRDPIARWMYPSPQEYLEHFPHFVKTFAAKAFDSESVYYLDGYLGAAIWFPPNTKPDSNDMAAFIQQTVAPQKQEELFAMFGQIEPYYPSQPYWYLGILGVDSFHQKKGYGATLLSHQLSLCDYNQQIAYLESSSPKQVPFYEKHGFKVIAEIQAGESPTIFPMVRHPQ